MCFQPGPQEPLLMAFGEIKVRVLEEDDEPGEIVRVAGQDGASYIKRDRPPFRGAVQDSQVGVD